MSKSYWREKEGGHWIYSVIHLILLAILIFVFIPYFEGMSYGSGIACVAAFLLSKVITIGISKLFEKKIKQ